MQQNNVDPRVAEELVTREQQRVNVFEPVPSAFAPYRRADDDSLIPRPNSRVKFASPSLSDERPPSTFDVDTDSDLESLTGAMSNQQIVNKKLREDEPIPNKLLMNAAEMMDEDTYIDNYLSTGGLKWDGMNMVSRQLHVERVIDRGVPSAYQRDIDAVLEAHNDITRYYKMKIFNYYVNDVNLKIK